MLRFVYSSLIEAPVETVFAFHERPDAFALLTPPWQSATVVRREGGIRDGGVAELSVGIGPLWRRWIARHSGYAKDRLFIDTQAEGPFRSWTHRHEFEAVGARTRLTDRIEFSLPGGAAMDALGGWLAMLQLQRMFRYRHEATRRHCERRG